MVEISHITKNEKLYVHITAMTVHVELVIVKILKTMIEKLADYEDAEEMKENGC